MDVLRFDVVTLFASMFAPLTDGGVTARAHERGLWSLATWNPRDFADDAYRTIDDRSYGGGPGMVMLAEPLARAVDAAKAADPRPARVLLMSPQGRRIDQPMIDASREGRFILVCGRYEGVDERFIESIVDEEISLGDFVLSGGEIAAMALIDGAVRGLPGALNDERSARQDSFAAATPALLDCPHYTRPEVWRGHKVPDVLLSGHHADIATWRQQQAAAATRRKRPDLQPHPLGSEQHSITLRHDGI
ncbi:tRNA (guanosine(37)-N1)-methyltransferase TrmD [soil metagenome]